MLKLAAGPAKGLTASASSRGQGVDVTLHSADGKPITLQQLRYACALPPAPTYCPPRKQEGGRHGYRLEVSTTRTLPLFLTATVGPVAVRTPPKASPAVAPPYATTEEARIAPKAGTKPAPASFSSTLDVRPGQLLILATRLTSRVRGAPQTVRITLNQGPDRRLRVSARARGGAPSSATIKSATGAPISLVLPRYSCFLPPAPTFCPPLRAKAGSHRYALEFSGSPSTPPIILVAEVQSG